MRAAAVADLPFALELLGRLSVPAIGPLASVDDDRHVRIVPVVLDHLVVQLGLELARDHAVDHPDSLVYGRGTTGSHGCRPCGEGPEPVRLLEARDVVE